MSWLLVALLGLGAAAGVGFAVTPPLGFVRLEPRDHAALSLAMPAGARQTELNTFEIGKVMLHMPAYQALVVVAWELGDSFDKQPEIVAGLLSEPGVTASLSSDIAIPIGGGLQGRSFWFTREGERIPGEHDRLRRSPVHDRQRGRRAGRRPAAPAHTGERALRCGRGTRSRPPALQAVIELPEGWGRIASPAGVLGLAGPDGLMWFRSLLIAPRGGPRGGPHAAQGHVRDGGRHHPHRRPQPPRRSAWAARGWRFDVEDEGETTPGWVTHWSCGPGQPGLVGVASAAGEESAEPLLGYLLSARCPRAGEDLPDYPSAPPKVIEAFGLEAEKPGPK